ncbi:MAG: aspartate aminotransferase family protein [Halanaerobiales bacterium]
MEEEAKSLIGLDEALEQSREEIKENYRNHLNPGLVRMFGLLNFDKKYVRAEGSKLWDSEDNEYYDFLGGYGALNLGHNPPEVIEAVNKVNHLPNLLQAGMGTMASTAAHNLALLAPGDLSHSFFCNSGTEAVEGAIKLARAASGRKKLIHCEGSFHGKTMGSLSLTGRDKYQKPFVPLMPGSERVSFGDTDMLEHELKKGDTAAFIVEPIQGEAGIIVPPEGYLKEVRKLCDKYDTYLIFDEIQTGLGRTGDLFACNREEVVPDIMCLAKSLGGGVMPVGAFITREDIWKEAYGSLNKALLHTSTFGGNNLAAAAVVATLEEIVSKNLSKKAAQKGEHFIKGLKRLQEKYELVDEVRGRGLMIGLEFKQPEEGLLNKLSGGMVKKLSHEYLGSMVAGTLLNDYQLLTAYTLNNPNVIRLEPPLIIEEEGLEKMLTALDQIFADYSNLLGLTMRSARSIISGLFN